MERRDNLERGVGKGNEEYIESFFFLFYVNNEKRDEGINEA